MVASLSASTIVGKYLVNHTPGLPMSYLLRWHDIVRQSRPGDRPEGAVPLNRAAVFRIDSPLGPLVFKRHVELGFKALLNRLHVRTPALLRAFEMGTKAHAAGLHTARPYCCFTRHRSFGYDSVLITEFIEHGASPWEQLSLAPGQVHAMLEKVGEEIADWHASGLRNRDLKGPNMIYRPESGILSIIDLNGVYERAPVPSLTLRSRDLSRCKAGAIKSGLSEQQWHTLQAAYLDRCDKRAIGIADQASFSRMIDDGVMEKMLRYQKLNKDFN